tara:strand:+ start:254 stop:508 length:255 start_codon:yes stop_codon:yes gene_type:complete
MKNEKQLIIPLVQSLEIESDVRDVLAFTQIRSEAMINALLYHLVEGASSKAACMRFDVKQQNFSRDLKKLNLMNTKLINKTSKK